MRHVGGQAAAEVCSHPGGAVDQEGGAEIGGVGIEGEADRALGEEVEIKAATQFEDAGEAGIEVEVEGGGQTLQAEGEAVVIGGIFAEAVGIGAHIGEVGLEGREALG